MNATTEQIEKAKTLANQLIEKGCKLPFEKVFEMQLKNIQKQTWNQMTKKDIAKANSRNNVETMDAPLKSIAEMMYDNAMNNLPSSLRK